LSLRIAALNASKWQPRLCINIQFYLRGRIGDAGDTRLNPG